MLTTQISFSRHLAFVIGVANYKADSISTLKTPLNDAQLVASQLAAQGFEVHTSLDPTATEMRNFLAFIKKECASHDTRVVIYYAGHGTQQDEASGLKGYLLPVDANIDDSSTLIAMQALDNALKDLPSRHVLLILDCCFAGTFRLSTTRAAGKMPKMTRQYYDMFTQYPSRKVLTSTSSRQKALDTIDLGDKNSPFARLLVQGISGLADEGDGDRLVTTSELHTYLKNQLTLITQTAGNQQSVEIGALSGDGDGEFIFFLDGFAESQLKIQDYDNPYKGLKSYNSEDAGIFFGRQKAIESLLVKVKEQRFVIVTGASGTGKSSLVKAGVLPRLQNIGLLPNDPTVIIIRPGKDPSVSLPQNDDWDLLMIDQWEEVITQANDNADIAAFYQKIKTWLDKGKRIIGTVRADFEAQTRHDLLEDYWKNGRFLVPAFTPDEYYDVIVQPARRVACLFEEASLIQSIQEEVSGEPGPLPLLSFLLQELFEKTKNETARLRQIKRKHYDELGGLSGALQGRAEQVYNDLKNTEGGQSMMRRIMLRLVAFSAGEMTGKRAFLNDLDFGDAALVKKVVTALDEARLIRLSTPEVEKAVQNKPNTEGSSTQTPHLLDDQRAYLEPAHDALVRSWKRLWTWVKDLKEENLLLFDKIATATDDYQRNGAAKKYLWKSDARLDQALELVAVENPFNLAENGFILLSRKIRRQNAWILRGSVAAAFVIVGGLALRAYQQQGIAEAQTSIALTEKKRANDSANVAQNQRKIAEKSEKIAQDSAKSAQEQRGIAQSKTIETQKALTRVLEEQKAKQVEERKKERLNFEQFYADGIIASNGEEYDLAKRKFNNALKLLDKYGKDADFTDLVKKRPNVKLGLKKAQIQLDSINNAKK